MTISIVLGFAVVFGYGLFLWNAQPDPPIENDQQVAREDYDQQLIDVVSSPHFVEVDLEPYVVDLSQRYVDEEWMGKMRKGDEKSTGDRSNSLREYRSSVGDFRVVSCYGRQSCNPDAKHSGGMLHEMVQLPNGHWVAGYPTAFEIKIVLVRNGRTFLVLQNSIVEYTDATDVKRLVQLKGRAYISIREEYGMILGIFLPVNKSSDSDFGGLLEETDDGVWIFHQYRGRFKHWVERYEEKDGHLVLELARRNSSAPVHRIKFDYATSTFVDLK